MYEMSNLFTVLSENVRRRISYKSYFIFTYEIIVKIEATFVRGIFGFRKMRGISWMTEQLLAC
jgi:hypothetical protein